MMPSSSGHLLNGNLHGNWGLDRSCRRKSCSRFRRPRGRRVGRIHLSRPRPGRPGRRNWASVARRDRHLWFSLQLWTPLDFPGSSWLGWGRHKRRDRRSLAAGFGSPLTAPGALGLFPLVLFLLLSPYISVTVPRLPPKATRNSVSWPKVANIAPKVGGGERHSAGF